MSYIIGHIPKDTPYNRRPGLPQAPEYITVHFTGNPSSTARNERAWLTNPANKRTASWHICVDERETVETIPLGEVAWHAGDCRNGPGNRKSIAIEICESGNRAKTLENAAELTAKLLQEKGWEVGRRSRPTSTGAGSPARVSSWRITGPGGKTSNARSKNTLIATQKNAVPKITLKAVPVNMDPQNIL